MTVGRSVSKKFDRTTWGSEWMPRQEKFSKKSIRAFSSWNWTWVRVESGVELEVDAPEWRGFRDRVNLHLSAIEQLIESERERERERGTNRKLPTQINVNKIEKKCYACMKNAWSCDMQQYKHHALNPNQSYQHTWFQHSKHTSKIHESLLKCKCDVMHEHLRSFKQNPSQKFRTNFINFEKPQKIFKNPKLRSNAWRMKDLGTLPMKKHLI